MTNVETEIAPASTTVPEVARDPYSIATAAGERLAQDITDEEARSAYGQALARLKLLDAARRSVVPWASRARRFAANLRALEERTPAGAALVRAAASNLSPYELHLAADGNFQILDTTAPVWRGWLGGLRGQLTHHKATEQLWQYDPQRNPFPPPMVFDSIGFGWLFLHALRTTEQAFLNYRCAFYVLERDPLMLAMAMHLHDMQEVIRSPRVRWFIGATDEETLSELRTGLTENSSWTLPQLYVRSNLRPRPRLAIEETVNEIGGLRQKRREAWVAEANAYYDGKDAAFWHARFSAVINGQAKAKPLRILGLTSRYTTVLKYSMAEMQEAVGRWISPAGGSAEMRTAIEPDDQSTENPFLETIATFKPDLIFQISRMRYENKLLPRNVPFLCWDQDNLSCMRTPQATASLNPLTYVAGHGAVYGHGFLNWPRESCIFCHPASATFRYSAEPCDAALLEKHACDVSFISNASVPPEELRIQQSERWIAYPTARRIFDQCAERILAEMHGGKTWEHEDLEVLSKQIATDSAESPPPEMRAEIVMSLAMLSDRCFRHTALLWAKNWCDANGKTLRLYGAGWERNALFAKHAAGSASPGEEVRAIYQASRINLQLIEGGFIHSRSLDGLSAGGFFLTRVAANDGRGIDVAEAMWEIAQVARELHLRTRGQLETSTDPRIQRSFKTLSRFMQHFERDQEMRCLEDWAEVPLAPVAIPQYRDISFKNEEEFGRLAQLYLADAQLRQSCTAEMRKIVLRDFSYSRRWEQFLEAIVMRLQKHNNAGSITLPALALT